MSSACTWKARSCPRQKPALTASSFCAPPSLEAGPLNSTSNQTLNPLHSSSFFSQLVRAHLRRRHPRLRCPRHAQLRRGQRRRVPQAPEGAQRAGVAGPLQRVVREGGSSRRGWRCRRHPHVQLLHLVIKPKSRIHRPAASPPHMRHRRHRRRRSCSRRELENRCFGSPSARNRNRNPVTLSLCLRSALLRRRPRLARH